tara:strand:+ start:89 stop:700 length:612 start_codon:yes stop_codon:yes gene_type:complete
MPYILGNIYKILCPMTNRCYVGSTFNDRLDHRMDMHIRDYKNKYGKFTVHKLFDKYGIDNFKIILIKKYLVYAENKKDHTHLSVYETLWINRLKSVNKLVPFNPLKKIVRRDYLKKYYKSDKGKESKKKYKEANKDKVKETSKKYYEENKETIKKREKKYYEGNRDTINEKRKEKIKCECGSIIRKDSLSRHIKTKTHLKNLQ